MAAEGSPSLASQFADRTHQQRAAVLGIWVFLATEALFFGTLFASYTIGRVLHPQAFAEASSHTDVVLGSINTALLLTTSLTMSLAVRAGAAGWRRPCVTWLVVSVVLGLAFLGLKGYEYHEDWTKGLLPGLQFDYSGPDVKGATLFFFMYLVMTAVHAVHLSVACGVATVMAVLTARGRFSAEYHTPLEVTGLYWHFVDIVWIFLYPLLYLGGRS